MFNFTKTLKEISGKNEKIDTLAEMIANDSTVAKICFYAMNPFYRYGFKKLPAPEATGKASSWDDLFAALDELRVSNRSNETVGKVAELLGSITGDDRVLFGKVLLKNLDCGVQVANYNAALKKSGIGMTYEVRDYPCMLVASDFDKYEHKFDWKMGVFSQEKCDGMRVNAIVRDENVEFFGRSGKPVTILSENIIKECQIARESVGYDCVLDGELLVVRDGITLDRKTGNGILNKAVRGTISKAESDQIHMTVWDVIPLDIFERGFGETEPYNKRFIEITKAVPPQMTNLHLVDSKIVYSKEDALADFQKKLSEGKEGVIIKSPTNVWKDTRVTDCVKLKAELDCDLKVVGWEEGTGKYEGMMGAILCESSDGLVQVAIGTGFSDEDRKEITRENSIGKIVTVVYNAKITSKDRDTASLFLPRIVEWRSDKTEADPDSKIK